MKEILQEIFYRYMMIMCALHLFSFGIIIMPFVTYSEGHPYYAILCAIIIYPSSFILLEIFKKE
jgi:hypothetical protein